MKVLLICSCSGMKERAKSSFKILFPKQEIPQMYVGRDSIKVFASEHENTNVYNYATAVSKQGGQFAYYVEYNDKGDVTTVYNLMNGKRVA